MTTPSSYLTLSEAPQVTPDREGSPLTPEDVQPAAHIRAELRRIRAARRTGAHRTARVHLDRLIDYIWFDPDGAA